MHSDEFNHLGIGSMKILKMIKAYGPYGFSRLVIDLAVTRLLFSKCRIVRRPFYIRNSGTIKWGSELTTGVGLRIDIVKATAVLKIGNNVQFNDYCHIGVAGYVEIGDGTLIASKVFITDHQHGIIKESCDRSSPDISPIERPLSNDSVIIGSNVWIGENVSIMPGIKIGNGCIIGASSVVTKDVPENSIAVGSPAHVIKKYNFDERKWENEY
jgi:lipopolysaccharide O-acetyltransferase